MKYCKFCGSVLEDDAELCLKCGCSTQIKDYGADSEGYNLLCILGFVFSFIASLVGFIISLIALNQVNKNPAQKGKGLAIAGIVISASSLPVTVFMAWVYLALLFGL